MKLTVIRRRKTPDGIFGMLSIDTNPFVCFTVENLLKAIPVGLYRVTIDRSERFNRQMPHVWVPERDEAAKARGESDAGIRIHWGNKPSNYEGCIGVGNKEEPDAIDDTVATFNILFKIMSQANDLTIEIKESYA